MSYLIPADLNLDLFCEVDSLAPVADGTPVGSFTDTSGNSNHFIASGSARPTYKNNVANGKAALNFTGAQQMFTTNSFGSTLGGQACSFFYVINMPATNGGYLLSAQNDKLDLGSPDGSEFTYFGAIGGAPAVLKNQVETRDGSNNIVLTTRTVQRIVIITYDGTTIYRRFNGGPRVYGAFTGNTNIGNTLSLGDAWGGGGAFTGYVHAIGAVGRVLSAEEEDYLFSYLSKYQSVQVPILCLGNSLTQGANASNYTTKPYPAVLQSLLGSQYLVLNAGHGSATINLGTSYNGGTNSAIAVTNDYTTFNMQSWRSSYGKAIAIFWEIGNTLSDWITSSSNYSAITCVNNVMDQVAAFSLARRNEGYQVFLLPLISRPTLVNNTTGVTFDQCMVMINAQLAAGWRRYADGFCSALLADNRFCAVGAGANSTWYGNDQIHLTDAGYAAFAADVAPGVVSLYTGASLLTMLL